MIANPTQPNADMPLQPNVPTYPDAENIVYISGDQTLRVDSSVEQVRGLYEAPVEGPVPFVRLDVPVDPLDDILHIIGSSSFKTDGTVEAIYVMTQ